VFESFPSVLTKYVLLAVNLNGSIAATVIVLFAPPSIIEIPDPAVYVLSLDYVPFEVSVTYVALNGAPETIEPPPIKVDKSCNLNGSPAVVGGGRFRILLEFMSKSANI
jgi:hypothetical protein